MSPNTISLFSTGLMLEDKKVRAPPDISSRQIRFSPERLELDTNGGAEPGPPATGYSVVQKRSERSWQSTRGLALHSPTALQNYAKCPYRLFLQTIHGLAPREIPEAIDQLDPLQRGSLIHEVQFNLFARLREDGFLPVRPSNLPQAQQRLDAVIAEVGARYKDDIAPAIDRVWEDGVAAIRADLREWLRRASEDESGYVPWRFELSFGLEHRPERRKADPQSISGAVGLDCGIQLRGSIDLVERHPSGLARVTDHKRGKADAKRSQLIDGGKSLQPLLYALAAEKLFGDEAEVTAGRLHFCTSVGGFAEHVVPLDESGRAAAAQMAEAIGDAVARPFLPASPVSISAENCLGVSRLMDMPPSWADQRRALGIAPNR